ncbi:MAG TPA: hypothetical protein ENG14_03190 [Thermodesulforhabdus norvegica]|uniref:Uncharacterized protein n=1 Tax=Thermodesulforhabdus norvegica TaxID=39841 RepID=A0A7C0WRX8_9BACT|nr:hypothetical protein [Thermodesulforhabdus norvegica]
MRKEKYRRRVLSFGAQTILSTLLFLGILVFIALIVEHHPIRWDLTKNKEHTLSEESQKVVKNLKEPVHILAFFSAGSSQDEAKGLLETYHYYNKKITYEFIDPDKRPELARKYEIRTYGTLVLEGYGKKETVQSATEEAITNALLKLGRAEKKKIYFLIGHGEHSVEEFGKTGYSTIKSALGKENYEVKELNLMSTKEVPEDASVVIVPGPHKSLFPEEVESLDRYIKAGGRIIVMLDPYQDGGLKKWLASYGVAIYDDVIIDKLSRIFGGSYLLPVVTQYGFHPITKDFRVATFYPEARSVREAKEKPDYVAITKLAMTSQGAWAEMNKQMLNQGQASYDEKEELRGPVPVVLLVRVDVDKLSGLEGKQAKQNHNRQAEKDGKAGKKGYLVVIGDSDFIDNTHFGLSGNGDFFLNIVHYLAEEQNLITIKPRKKEGQPLVLTANQMRLVFWISLVLIPLVVILAGVGVYRRRRSQK